MEPILASQPPRPAAAVLLAAGLAGSLILACEVAATVATAASADRAYIPLVERPLPTPTPTPLPPDVRVDPACSDFQHGTREDPSGEYVCLRSYDQRSISLAGWRLEDAAHHRYVFPLFVLAPGEKVKVHSGQGQNTQTDLYTGSNLIWNNDGDTVFLYDALGRLITSYSY